MRTLARIVADQRERERSAPWRLNKHRSLAKTLDWLNPPSIKAFFLVTNLQLLLNYSIIAARVTAIDTALLKLSAGVPRPRLRLSHPRCMQSLSLSIYRMTCYDKETENL